MDSSSPACVSFIGIVDFTEDANWVYCSESVYDLLGYEPHELIGTSSLLLVHPDEFSEVKELHYTTISQDQAAVLAYLRMKHKDPYKGYILCGISRTVCQNVLVGSVSFAAPGPKAMHNASTAQEVKIITPTAKDLEFRRWNDPNPMPPCPIPNSRSASPDPDRDRDRDRSRAYDRHHDDSRDRDRSYSRGRAPARQRAITFDPLPEQSIRTALILDRFSVNCTILYCANDSLLATTTCMGRSFFDFVARRDEDLVRSWIDVIKSWGVNERGQPSDGGFGFGKFTVLVNGRDSSIRHPDPVPSRHRHNSFAHSSQYGHHADSHSHGHHSHHLHSHSRTRDPHAHAHSRAHLYSPTGSGYRERPAFNDRDSASSLYRIASGSTNGGSGSGSGAGTGTERDRTNERSEKYNEKYGTGTPAADRTDKSERGKANGRSVPVGSAIGGRAARGERDDELVVDAIFSAHSDGLMVILRRASS
ncbi:hypothetical protein PYCCODRAFT_602563 [Trametes coccinea BRFM310]|uniref:PAS domain-containing protein n=1 Tax=Trametes coccinea (strain BRFM310) TaxID=1353009 RepID=A0A1Y2J1S6_TRAC3|nr:hypothetical protein PYCCODRAFT_602563 [Trametes coccinea BRFM310]